MAAANSRPASESPACRITGRPCGLRGTLNRPLMSKCWSACLNPPTAPSARNRPLGLSAIDDQRLAGSVMMIEGSLVTIVALSWLFLRLAAEGEQRQRLLERGLDPRAVRRAVRYGRAQELEQAH